MRWIWIAIIIGLSSFNYAAAQFGQEFSHLRSARNIAWGQAAVAASNGVAAMNVNSASLGGFSGYGVSTGFGQTWPGTKEITAYDVGVAGAVMPGRLGVGATWSTLNMQEGIWRFDQSLLRLHGGYRVLEGLDVGVEAARYSVATEGEVRHILGEVVYSDTTVLEETAVYDLGLSARAVLRDLAEDGDALTIGLQIVNLLDTRVKDADLDILGTLKDKVRHVRLGALWSIPLEDPESSRLKPRLLLGAGATMIRITENASNVYPGATVGASVLDMVTFLFNYEEEDDDRKMSLRWYPVIRIGVLTDLPVGEWLGLDNRLDVSLDYVFWKEHGDTADLKYVRGDTDWQREAWSIAVHYTP